MELNDNGENIEASTHLSTSHESETSSEATEDYTDISEEEFQVSKVSIPNLLVIMWEINQNHCTSSFSFGCAGFEKSDLEAEIGVLEKLSMAQWAPQSAGDGAVPTISPPPPPPGLAPVVGEETLNVYMSQPP